MRDFTSETFRVEIEDSFALLKRAMQLYSQDVSPGQVTLGGNQATGYAGQIITHYIVIVEPLD